MDAVVFDLDDTLIVEQSASRAAIAHALLSVVGLPTVDASMIETAFACAQREWRNAPCYESCDRLGMASWEGLWSTFAGCHRSLEAMAEWVPSYRRAAWGDTLHRLGANAARAEEAAQSYIDRQRLGHPEIESAIDAARWASNHLKTAVLTNGPPDIQRLKLAQCGVGEFVDTVVISGETGWAKPDGPAFRLVLEQLDVRASETVMVGDSWRRDVVGSISSGLRAVWVSHGRPLPEERPDVLVAEELSVEVLERL